MKRSILAILVIIAAAFSAGAQTTVFSEDFESLPLGLSSSGNVSWARSSHIPASGTWCDTVHLVSVNDQASLTSTSFSTSGHTTVLLKFKQICKLEFQDGGIIEVSTNNGSTWTVLPAAAYQGTGQYGSISNKFNSVSYLDWLPASNNAIPTQNWWKQESFDISTLAANSLSVMVRFTAKDLNSTGPVGNYGWLIDDIEVIGAASEITPPTVTMLSPVIQDTIYSTGPFNITADITDASGIDTAYVVYTINSINDTVGMLQGASNRYTAVIPSQAYGTSVCYKVVAIDGAALHNATTWPVSGCTSFHTIQGPTQVQAGTAQTSGYGAPIFISTAASSSLYSRHIALYTAAELGKQGNIKTLSWRKSNFTGYTAGDADIRISIKNTSAQGVPSTASSFDTEVAGATLFHLDTNLSLPTDTGWITFSTPGTGFAFNGTDNIMVLVEFYRPSASSGDYMNWDYTLSTGKAITWYGSAPQPTLAYATDQRPNTRFGIYQTLFPNDASLWQILRPQTRELASGAIPFTVRVRNEGSVNLSSVNVNWKLDGQTKTPVSWTGTLQQHMVSNDIQLSPQTLATGPHDVIFWTSLPNSSTDNYMKDDTMSTSFYVCAGYLSGYYTVGNSGADFANLAEVTEALHQCGVSGPVTFALLPGVYETQVELYDSIPGISSVNTVTFTSSTGNRNDVVMRHNSLGSTDNYIFLLNGADFITIDAITLENKGAVMANVLTLTGGANHITLSNCLVQLSSPYNYFARAIDVKGSASHLTVTGNTFTDGSYPIYWVVPSGSTGKGLTVSNNTFTGYYNSGIYTTSVDSISITGNEISTFKPITSSSYGVYVYICKEGFEMKDNRIDLNVTGGGYGAYVYGVDPGSSWRNTISNNMITVRGVSTSSVVTGLNLESVDSTDIVYNSINVACGHATSECIYVYSGSLTSAGLVFRNNNIAHTGYGYAIEVNTNATSSVVSSDYNNIYTNGLSLAKIGSLIVATSSGISGLSTITGMDVNSVSTLPKFYTVNNLHTYSSVLNGAGTPFSAVTTDIDGETRSAGSPDIGADEFVISTNDVGIIDILVPDAVENQGSSITLAFLIGNFGTATQTSIPFAYTLDGGTAITGTWTGSLAQGALDTAFVTGFSVPALFHDIKAFTTLSTDGQASNDSSVTSFYGFPAIDAEVVSLLEPSDGCGLGTESVKVLLRNNGSGSITSGLSVSYKIDGAASAVTETVSTTIGANDSLEYTFNTGVNMSIAGSDSIFGFTVWTAHAQDPLQVNDTLRASVLSQSNLAPPLVSDTTIAYGDSVVLNAWSTQPVKWYDDSLATAEITSGFSFQTPQLFDTTTYWAQAGTGSVSKNGVAGNGTALNDGYTMPCPFGGDFGGSKQEFLYLATELQAMGITAGTIDTIGFFVSLSYNTVHTGYELKMGMTNSSSQTSSFNSTGTTVLLTTVNEVTGWNKLALQTPFYWDGNSNIFIQICKAQGGFGGNPPMPYTTMGFTAATIANGFMACNQTTGYTSSNRPNTYFATGAAAGCVSLRTPVTVNVPPPDDDALIASIDGPASGCGLDTADVTVTIVNHGLYDINGNLQVSYRINNTSWISPESVTDTIKAGNSLVYTFATQASLYAGPNDSTYYITAKAILPGDDYHGNDSLVSDPILSRYTPVTPIVSSVTVPYASPAIITAIANDTLYWYDAATGGNLLFTGNPFITNPLYDSATYYVEAKLTQPVANYTLGAGNLVTTGAAAIPTPYGTSLYGARSQYLITAAELAATGLQSGMIESIAFKANASSAGMSNYQLKIGQTSATQLSSFLSGLTSVYSNNSLSVIPGFNEHIFSTPFYWDGYSNLVIETCFKNNGYGSIIPVFHDTTSYNASAFATGTSSFACGVTAATSFYKVRPQILFKAEGYGICGSPRVPVDVIVTGIPLVDASLLSIVEPSGQQTAGTPVPVKVVIKNYASTPLTAVNIHGDFDGTAMTPYAWTGSLSAGQIDTVVLGNITPGGGYQTLTVWTANPNGITDPFPSNDTANASISSCFSGTFGIGVGKDFPSLTQAVNELTLLGVCGNVIIEIDSGYYADQLIIGAIPGTSAGSMITFTSATGDSSDVRFIATISQTTDYVFRLHNTSYINFEHISVKGSGGNQYNRVIQFTGTTHHITFSNCEVEGEQLTLFQSYPGVFHSDGQDVQDLTFRNNRIISGYHGIYLKGVSTSNTMSNIVIEGNQFEDFQYSGVYLYYANNAIVRNNNVNGSLPQPNYGGIRFLSCAAPIIVTGNKIELAPTQSGTGIEFSTVSGTSSLKNTVANNFIVITTGNSSGHKGIYTSSANYTDVVFNSIRITAGNTSTRGIQNGNGSNIRILNNVISLGVDGDVLYTNSIAAISTCDYNAFKVLPVHNQFAYWTTAVNSLSALQTLDINNHQHSFETNPQFQSLNDLHSTAVSLNGTAIPVAGITLDIDGDTRNVSTPDIGADEFTPPAIDMGIVSWEYPMSGCGFSSSDSIKVRIINSGMSPMNFATQTVTVKVIVSGILQDTITFIPASGILTTGQDIIITIATNYNLGLHGAAYHFDASVMVGGDGNMLNNAISTVDFISFPDISVFPYSTGFESGGNFSLNPLVGTNAGLVTDINAANNSLYGLHFQGGTGFPWSNPSNVTNAFMNNPNSIAQASVCEVDATGLFALRLKFDLKQTYSNPSQPGNSWFRVLAIDAFGNPYYIQDQNGDSVFQATTPIADPFVTHIFDLNNWVGQVFSLRFESVCKYEYGGGTNNAGDNAYVDNLSIWVPTAEDVAATLVKVNGKPFGPIGTSKTVTIRVENFGTVPVDSIPVGYSVNGIQVDTDTIFSTIIPNGIDSLTFTMPFGLASGTSTLCGYTVYPGDVVTANDTTCSTVKGFQSFTVDYSDNFDIANNWATFSQNQLWERGVPAGTIINSAYSSPNAWVTDLNANYTLGLTEYLYSPYITIPANADTAVLEFRQWMAVLSTHAYGQIQYSFNGNTWASLGFIGDPNGTNWYGTNLNGTHVWSSSTAGWIKSSYKLNPSTFNTGSSFQLRFKFVTDGYSVTSNGWAIDNFAITIPTLPNDLGVLSFNNPQGQTVTGDTITVSVQVVNYGGNAQSNFPIIYYIQNLPPVLETVAGPLGPLDTMTYVFATKYLSPNHPYLICSATILSGDMNTGNDTVCQNMVSLPGPIDGGVTAITSPGWATPIGGQVDVVATIKNFGTNTLSSIPVFYSINGNVTAQETWTGTLLPNATTNYQFSTTFTSPVGTYVLCAGTELIGDANTTNDDHCVNVVGNAVDDITANRWSLGIFPNPTRDKLTVRFETDAPEDAVISIFGLAGNLIMRKEISTQAGTNEFVFDLSSLSAGTYLMQYSIGAEAASSRISIVK